MKHAKLLFLLITALAFVSCSSSNDERRRRYNLSLSHFQELHILMCLFSVSMSISATCLTETSTFSDGTIP